MSRRRAENAPPNRRRRTTVIVRESGEIPLWTAPPAAPTVTEDDVIACLAGLGDDFVSRYRSGELSRDEAHSMARRWKRQSFELQR